MQTQPSKVSTEDTARPPDDAVITDETKRSGADDQAAPAESGEPNAEASAPTDPEKEPQEERVTPRRFRRMQARLAKAQKRNEELEGKVNDLAGKVDELLTATPKRPEPKLDDFDSPQAYAKAYAQWEKSQQTRTTEPPKRQPATATPANPDPAQEQRPPVVDKEYKAFLDRGTQALGDEFLEALDEPIPVNKVMGDFILESDHGPELFMLLADDQELAAKIYDKSAPAAFRELEKLEKQVANKPPSAGIREPKPGDAATEDEQPAGDDGKPAAKTGAPPPPENRQERGRTVPEGSLEELGMDDYAERRRKDYQRTGRPL